MSQVLKPAPPLADCTLRDVQARMRALWGEEAAELPLIVAVLGKVQGDLCAVVREDSAWWFAGQAQDDLKRELGNLVLTSLRAMDTLALDLEACLQAAETAQRAYVERQEAENE